MKPLTLFFITLVLLTSCSTNTPETTPITPSDLTGKLFLFAPELDTASCKVYGKCDCCMDDLFFVDDTHFVRDLYCVEADDIRQGTYRLENNTVILNYDAEFVKAEYNWERDRDNTKNAPEHLVSLRRGDRFSDTLFTSECKGSLVLMDRGSESMFYGQIDPQQKPETFKLQLQDAKIWEKLRLMRK
ncbi:MAG: hypothetical protein V4616_08255 [Bacteroidota bacterium]